MRELYTDGILKHDVLHHAHLQDKHLEIDAIGKN